MSDLTNNSKGKRSLSYSLAIAMTAAVALPAAGCADEAPQGWAMQPITSDYTFPTRDAEGKIVKEGKVVSAVELDMGRQSYVHYCYACHGMDGDGNGPAAHGLRPPPRDFRAGVFKFGAVRSGEKPNDDDLMRIVKGGLHGTAMLPWDIPDDQLMRILQFIKTFPPAACDPKVDGEEKCAKEAEKNPEGRKNPWLDTYKSGKKKGQPKPTGEPIAITEDPWKGKAAEAVAKGEEVYHLKAQCANCHPTYLTRQAYSDLSTKVEGKPKTEFREAMYASIVLAAKDNPYKVNLVPPDFTLNPLRSIRDDHEMDDLYRLIASGVGGVMPAWVDGLKQDELWALAHYVKSLHDLAAPENGAKLAELRNKLANQPKGPVKADSDGDGIMDADDACPKDKGVSSSDPKRNGCAKLVELADEAITLVQPLAFEDGKAALKADSNAVLDRLAAVIKEHPELKKIEIGGYAVDAPEGEDNKKLSTARAEAVMAALVERGVEEDRLTAKGYGDKAAEGEEAKSRIALTIVERAEEEEEGEDDDKEGEDKDGEKKDGEKGADAAPKPKAPKIKGPLPKRPPAAPKKAPPAEDIY